MSTPPLKLAFCATSPADKRRHNFTVMYSTRHFMRALGGEVIWSRVGQVSDCHSHDKSRRRVLLVSVLVPDAVTPLLDVQDARVQPSLKSNADQGSWGLCSDREYHGKTTPARTSLTMGKATFRSPD